MSRSTFDGKALAEESLKRTRDAQIDFLRDLSLLKYQAGKLGLYLTMQRLDAAVVIAGFEVAGDREAGLRYEKRRQG